MSNVKLLEQWKFEWKKSIEKNDWIVSELYSVLEHVTMDAFGVKLIVILKVITS